MGKAAKVIGFGNRAPAEVLLLVKECLKNKIVSSIIPIHSYKIESGLLKAPYQMFMNGNGDDDDAKVDDYIIIYCLPHTTSEYFELYKYVNEIRNSLINGGIIFVPYSSELDSFIGWKNYSDVINSLGNEDKVLKIALESLKIFAEWDIKLANINYKTVLVVGAGGREHAIAVALSKSIQVNKVLVCPGNGGTVNKVSMRDGDGVLQGSKIRSMPLLKSISSIVEYCKNAENNVDLVLIGPEQPLVEGIVDILNINCPGLKVFGPTKAASILEASKAFTKDFLQECCIPTASYRTFTNVEDAKEYVSSLDYRVVVKASGLAAGKGVLLPTNLEETFEAIETIMSCKKFGKAGDLCVIEEYLEGEEASCLALCDGRTAKLLPAAQDHKRALDGDLGLNTGGMGAYAPTPVVTDELQSKIEKMCQLVVETMNDQGTPYVGVLYAGMMLTAKGPYVLEFNCRFGDPEAQVVLPLLESDFYEVISSCCTGTLSNMTIVTNPNLYAATVVCAAKGYPEKYQKGMTIEGLSNVNEKEAFVYHAGTIMEQGEVKCNGGRVLSVTGLGRTFERALKCAYKNVEKIDFRFADENRSYKHYRKDIGHRAIPPQRKLRLGVLGSTRGTTLLSLIKACDDNLLAADIVCVISNKKDALILEKATHMPSCQSIFLSPKGLTRVQYDAQVTDVLLENGVECVLLIGYMRILSNEFTLFWSGKCLNVHPSLLPKFAGGMDLDVHQAVIDAGETITGCTVHYVTEKVDGGPIAIQKFTSVYPNDTSQSLKTRVQALEGDAFIDAINNLLEEKKITYASAGVDIEKGNAFVDKIKPLCSSTKRPGCDAILGGFGGLFDLSAAGYDSTDTVLIGATDGVGTKLRVAHIMNLHETIGIDLVAMCVNDLIVAGAEPLFFLDYLSTSKLNLNIATNVMRGIAQGCKLANCGLIGGETAEMPGMYKSDEYDLAGFAVGAVNRHSILPQNVEVGDVLLGLASSGIHSNGYSLVRKIIDEDSELDYSSQCPWDSTKTLANSLLTPTEIYVPYIIPLLKQNLLKGLAHITGGGLLENLPRSLPESIVANITFLPNLPPVFQWIQTKTNLQYSEMLRTFNCGIGMVLILKQENLEKVTSILESKLRVFQIGVLISQEDEQTEKVIIQPSLSNTNQTGEVINEPSLSKANQTDDKTEKVISEPSLSKTNQTDDKTEKVINEPSSSSTNQADDQRKKVIVEI